MITSKQPNPARRATRIVSTVIWLTRSEIMFTSASLLWKVLVASVSKGSLPLDMWYLSRSSAREVISLINLSFLQTLQMCMTCSMSLSFGSASRLLTAPSTSRTLSSKKISLIVSTPLLFLKRPNARLATSQSNSSKSNGHTIPTVKLPGNTRITSVLSTRHFSSPRSRDEILS